MKILLRLKIISIYLMFENDLNQVHFVGEYIAKEEGIMRSLKEGIHS